MGRVFLGHLGLGQKTKPRDGWCCSALGAALDTGSFSETPRLRDGADCVCPIQLYRARPASSSVDSIPFWDSSHLIRLTGECPYLSHSSLVLCGSTIIFYFLVDGSSRWVVLQPGPAVAVELHSHQFPVAVWLLVELCQLAMRPRRGAAEAPCGGLCTDRLFVFRTIRAVGCLISCSLYSRPRHSEFRSLS